jgi:hypothetical protein
MSRLVALGRPAAARLCSSGLRPRADTEKRHVNLTSPSPAPANASQYTFWPPAGLLRSE